MRQWRTFSADRAEGENAVRPADQAESERKRLSGQAPAQRDNKKHTPRFYRNVMSFNSNKP